MQATMMQGIGAVKISKRLLADERVAKMVEDS